jgi:type IV secretory pathway VirB3-like protein
MPQRVMRSIANPPLMFWAPVELALMNFLIAGSIMIFGFAFELNPLWALAVLAGNHIGLAIVGAREPHAYRILMCWSKANIKTKNLLPTKRNKFVP